MRVGLVSQRYDQGPKEEHEEQIVQQIATCQGRLFAYILTLVPSLDVARYILQESNLVLWRRRDEFSEGTSFIAWASKVAFFQVLAYRRDTARDRHVFFSEELMTQLAGEVQEDLDVLADRHGALQGCLGKLTERQRWLIAQKPGLAPGRRQRGDRRTPGPITLRLRLGLQDSSRWSHG